MKKIHLNFLLLICFDVNLCLSFNKPFTIMINPAGDAKDAGRILNDSFERGITLQFAQELKRDLESNFPQTRIVLTRIPGETLEFLQNANFANRLDVDFYLSIHFYKQNTNMPNVFIYYYLTDPFYAQSSIKLHFYSFDNAHLINISKTIHYCEIFKRILNNSKNKFDVKGIFGCPFKPLVGIKAASLALEIGLKNTKEYLNYIQPVVEAIGLIVNE